MHEVVTAWARRARALLGCGLCALGIASAVQASPAPPVDGLIVQLRDAPTHVGLARERAQATGTATIALQEGARWQRLLTAVAPDMRLRERRAVLASAQQLRFEKPLSQAEAQALAQRLAAQPEVAWAVPDTRERRLQNAPSDPYFNQQWWAHPVAGGDAVPLEQRLRGVPGYLNAWVTQSTGAPAAVVAVLDSGVLKTHPELQGRLLPGYDMVSGVAYANDGDGRDADPSDPGDWVSASDKTNDRGNFDSCDIEDSKWHGTAIAGIVGALADNGMGMAGINWSAGVLPVRVAGKCGAAVSDIVDGMRWAAGLDVCKRSDALGSCLEFVPRNLSPVRIVNISFGGSGVCTPYQGTIDELKARGVVVVAAAGNEHSTPTRPAKCPGVVGVVALNRDGFKSNYSNFGAELAGSGIATVGGDDNDPAARWNALADSGILSIGNTGRTVPQANDYFYYYGTSFSAPLVAGAVSLMLSVNPNLTHDQLVQGLQRSARPHVTSMLGGVNLCSQSNPGRCLCNTSTCGAGILDVMQALLYARDPAAYVAPSAGAAVIDSAELGAAAALGADRPANSAPVSPPTTGGGGGGAMSLAWLAALAGAVWLLRSRRRA
jgi:serine protease